MKTFARVILPTWLAVVAVGGLSNTASAADTAWCNDSSKFSDSCQKDCCYSWPREYLHKAPRGVVLADVNGDGNLG